MSRFTDGLTCEETQARLDDFLDASLADSGRRLVERHVAACGSCGAEFARAQAILRALRSLPEVDCPPHVAERAGRLASATPSLDLAAAPRAAEPPSLLAARQWRPRLPAWRWLAAAAALLLLLSTVWLMNFRRPPTSAAEVARGTAQARFALAYVARVSERSGSRFRDEILGRRVVRPLAENVSRSLWEVRGERRDAAQNAARALRRDGRKET